MCFSDVLPPSAAASCSHLPLPPANRSLHTLVLHSLRAFYRKSKEWHPDKVTEEKKEEATIKFQRINAASQVGWLSPRCVGCVGRVALKSGRVQAGSASAIHLHTCLPDNPSLPPVPACSA